MFTYTALPSVAAQRREQLLADAAHARRVRELRATQRVRRSTGRLTTGRLRPIRIAWARLAPQA
jgi:hypothetical protein